MDSCCPDIIAFPYVSQMYSYSLTASADALGLESAGLSEGSGVIFSDEALPELSGVLTVDELSGGVVAEELSGVFVVEEFSGVLVVEGLSGVLSVEELPVAVVVDELSTLLVLSLLSFTELCGSPEQAENETAITAAENNAANLFFMMTFLSVYVSIIHL